MQAEKADESAAGAVLDIVTLPGDGIGMEVTREAVRVLQAIGNTFDLEFTFRTFPVGGASIDRYGVPILDEVIEACQKSDAVFLGAVGGPKWDDVSGDKRPEVALLTLRKALGLFTNLRPVKVYDALIEASTLKSNLIRGVDILVVRELTGGIYFGEPRLTKTIDDGEEARDTMVYHTREVERIARVAFEAAADRSGKVTSVDKANILASSQLWRKVTSEIAEGYPEIEFEHMLVDNCAMQLVRDPGQFDVILTTNMFGDILSDEASMLTGSLGMLPSASLGEGTAMYEPVHGSAPDIAGQGKANPLAAIGSVALLLRHSLNLPGAADLVEAGIESALNAGHRPPDLYTGEGRLAGTTEITDAIIERIEQRE